MICATKVPAGLCMAELVLAPALPGTHSPFLQLCSADKAHAASQKGSRHWFWGGGGIGHDVSSISKEEYWVSNYYCLPQCI